MNALVFLDIDGVCNSERFRFHRGLESIEPGCLFDLLSLLKQTGADVVISSSWREFPSWTTLPEFKKNFSRCAIEHGCPAVVVQQIVDKFVGMTLPFSLNRGEEIFEWLFANEHTGPFVVLDDDREWFKGTPDIFMEHVVFTNDNLGLVQRDVQAAIEILGR